MLVEFAAAKLSCLNLLAELAALRGNDQQAKRRFCEALTLAQQWGYVPPALEAFVGIAKLAYRRGQKKQAAELVTLAAGHPASTQETKDRARQVLGELEPALASEIIPAVSERYGQRDIQEIIEETLAMLREL